MNTALIYAYCHVIAELSSPCHAIFFFDHDEGYAKIETRYEGVVSFSCKDKNEFLQIVEVYKDM